MSGLFKRLSSRRSAGPEGTEPQQAAEPGTANAPASAPESEGHRPLFTDPAAPTRVLPEGEQPSGLASGDPLAGEPPVGPAPLVDPGPAAAEPNTPAPFIGPVYQPPAAPPVEPVADLPAGLDPDELAAAPSTSARRGKLRRRVAFLRAARELLLRDLGGFIYELHRTAHDVEHDAHRRLRETKLARLSRVDAELHELEMRLDDVRRQVLVREPGVGGECPHCGELFGSAAHYCSNCGNPLTEAARRQLTKAHQPEPAAPPTPGDQPTQEIPPLDPDHPSAPADFQWPRRETAGATPVGEGDAAASGGATPVGEGDAAARAGETTPVGKGDAAASDDARADQTSPVAKGEPAAAPGDATPVSAGGTAAGAGETTPVGEGAMAAATNDARAGEMTPVGEGDAAASDDAQAYQTTPVDKGDPAAGDATAAGEGDAAARASETTPVGDGDATASGDAHAGEASAVGQGDTSASDDAAGETTPVGEGDAGASDDAHAGETPPVGEEDAAAARDDAAAKATPVGESDAAATRDDASAPPARSGDDAAGETGESKAADYETWRGEAAAPDDPTRNGRPLRPVERRR